MKRKINFWIIVAILLIASTCPLIFILIIDIIKSGNLNFIAEMSSENLTAFYSYCFILFLGILSLIIGKLKIKERNFVIDNGIKIEADYIGVEEDRIVCRWKNVNDGNIYYFRSEMLFDIDIEKIIKAKNISKFTIYYNPEKINLFVVDTSDILKMKSNIKS